MEMGWYNAPAGTLTVTSVAEEFTTVPFTPPKKTILFDAIELKFVPVRVTTVPAGPLAGEKEIMEGFCEKQGFAKNVIKAIRK